MRLWVFLLVIEVFPFWIAPTPREIRLKKLNVSPTLYCNVLPLTVYFIGKLMYWQNIPLFDTWINIANWRPGTYSVFRHGRIRHLPPPCMRGGVPVHHDPMHGIGANLGLPQSRAWGHGELGPPHACRVEAGAGSDHDGTRNMSQGVNLLYLFRYQIGGYFVST